jgi:cytochrome bd ubiquinol oxidase subunit II
MIPFWFTVITILWIGFFVLEGFDFGVGMLHAAVGRDEAGRRAVINTIGPLWDGNEVWLIVVAAAIFAAFPGWYATMFSAFYLAMVLLLASLIVRGVAFEYRGKRDSPHWRRTWDVLLTVGSLLAPFLLGVVLGDLLNGLPINASQNYTGTFWGLFAAYGVFTGVAFVAICLLHGAAFLTLKTTGDMNQRARWVARRVAPATGLIVLAWVSWTHAISGHGTLLNPIELATWIFVIAAVWLVYTRSEGWAFTMTTATFAFSVLAIFVDLYPRVMVSSTSHAFSLTVHNTASPHYSLVALTVVAAILLPFVLAYQAWTYHVFRRRVTKSDFQPAAPPPSTLPGPRSPAATSDAAPPPVRRRTLPAVAHIGNEELIWQPIKSTR